MSEVPEEVLEFIKNATDLTLVAKWTDTQIKIAEKEAKLKAELKPALDTMELVKDELKARLLQRGANDTKTKAGTAYLSHHLNVQVTNRDALLSYAQENWKNGGGALVVIKPPVDAVRDHLAMHGGTLPPGIETSTFTRINIRGSK